MSTHNVGFYGELTKIILICSPDKMTFHQQNAKINSRKNKMVYSKAANNKGADQTVRMHRLICAFVIRIWHRTGFQNLG